MAAASATMFGLENRRYPGRCLGSGMQRRGVNAAREPLRSDAVLRSVQRVRRNSHRQFRDEPPHASKNVTPARAPLEIVHAQCCSQTMVEERAVSEEVTAPNECCHSQCHVQVPSDTESRDVVEIVSAANDEGVLCCDVEVPFGDEAPCVGDHFDYVAGVSTACVSYAKDSQPEHLDDISTAKDELKITQLEHSLHPLATTINFRLRASSSSGSSSSSSPLPTPRRPSWEETRGHSKNEIEAILSLGVVTQKLRARHGKADTFDSADTWAKLAAAGA